MRGTKGYDKKIVFCVFRTNVVVVNLEMKITVITKISQILMLIHMITLSSH